jgi:hypothetical protein
MLKPNIKSKVDALWNKFWSGGISVLLPISRCHSKVEILI